MSVPQILLENGLFLFENKIEYRDLSVPVVELNVSDLDWVLDMPVWERDGTDDWNLTPREVLEKKEHTKEHQKRVLGANTSFPIIVFKYKDKYCILDGVHRLCRMIKEGFRIIKVKVVPDAFLVKRYSS